MTQMTLSDAGTPLADVTFVVVDLETTGSAPVDAGITEIGAVKIRGGEVIGEFASLVNPEFAIPPFIAALTGITESMLVDAPKNAAIIPSFLEFARDTVLVAHNAGYDISFLKGACAKLEIEWPGNTVLDTAKLARHILTRGEVRNCKLSTLAAHFNATTTPTHRALDDARATVDVLHGLMERVGALGVHSLEELSAYTSRVSPQQRAKRHLADRLPTGPGVYIFEDARGEALYVGTSSNIRARVRNYFTASEQRTRMAEMVGIATNVRAIECGTTLEASIRELRLIDEHRPRYNRRSRHPEKQVWLKLTVEAYPRFSIVREVKDDGGTYLGPFRSKTSAEQASEAIIEATKLRSCTLKLSAVPKSSSPQCALADMGRCLSPCSQPIAEYVLITAAVQQAMSGDVRLVHEVISARMKDLAEQQRFEDAQLWRDRLAAYVAACVRTEQLRSLASTANLVAAVPTADAGWDVHVIRFGKLAGVGRIPARTDPRSVLNAINAAAEHVSPRIPPQPAALTEETQLIERWLESDGVRLVHCDGGWSLPLHCGGALAHQLRQSSTVMYAEQPRAFRPVGPVVTTSRISAP